MRTAIYTRISEDSTGQALGVQRQLDDCMALAEQLRWEVIAHHDDNDLSAFSGRTRPGFEALLDGMKRGQYDALICWHTDRLYRRIGDLERLIEYADGARVQIRTVQGSDLDLSNSSGRMIACILASVARQESEHMAERRVRANEQKAAAGKWQTGNRTFGYTMDGQPLEPEASAVRQAVADVLAGKSIQGIARQWNEAGLKTTLAGTTRTDPHSKKKIVVDGTWSAPSVRRLLINPRYAGLKVHRGKVVGPGDWVPLIDPDIHRGLEALLTDPARVKCSSFERKYLGSGLYLCGRCSDGTTMRAAIPGGRKSRAYQCRAHAHLVRSGEPLDDFVTAHILERIMAPDAADLLANQGVDVGALTLELEALQRKLDKTTKLYDDDAISPEQFADISRSTRSKMRVIEQQLADVTRVSPATALVSARKDAWKLWQDMTPTQRAQAVDEVAVVTVLPCPKGLRRFDPQYIDVRWRRVPDPEQ